jgi:hypothetical protein
LKLKDILKSVGSAVIRNVIPGGGVVIDAVNAMLPDDKKLPNDATGEQVKHAVDSLPPDQAAMIMAKELDVEIEQIRSWAQIQDSLAKADASGSSTRPWIAKLMAVAVFITIMTVIAAWASAMLNQYTDVLKQIKDSWEFLAIVLAIPSALLRAYFGMRTKEKQARYSAASGQELGGIGKILGALKK